MSQTLREETLPRFILDFPTGTVALQTSHFFFALLRDAVALCMGCVLSMFWSDAAMYYFFQALRVIVHFGCDLRLGREKHIACCEGSFDVDKRKSEGRSSGNSEDL